MVQPSKEHWPPQCGYECEGEPPQKWLSHESPQQMSAISGPGLIELHTQCSLSNSDGWGSSTVRLFVGGLPTDGCPVRGGLGKCQAATPVRRLPILPVWVVLIHASWANSKRAFLCRFCWRNRARLLQLGSLRFCQTLPSQGSRSNCMN